MAEQLVSYGNGDHGMGMLFEDVICGSCVGPRWDPMSMGGRWTGAPGVMEIGGEGHLLSMVEIRGKGEMTMQSCI